MMTPPSVGNNNLTSVPKIADMPPVSDMRSALMDSIRNGGNLKKVDTSSNTSTSSGCDSRGDLMSEIQKGIKLKPASTRESNPLAPNRSSGGGNVTDALAQALRDALASRGQALRPESSDSESDDNNDEDWDD